MDQGTQDNVIIGLKNFYNTIDFEFWLVVADRPVDISVYVSQLTLMLNEQLTPAVRKMVQQDIDKANYKWCRVQCSLGSEYCYGYFEISQIFAGNTFTIPVGKGYVTLTFNSIGKNGTVSVSANTSGMNVRYLAQTR